MGSVTLNSQKKYLNQYNILCSRKIWKNTNGNENSRFDLRKTSIIILKRRAMNKWNFKKQQNTF
jgi:hypothetical protein